MTKCLKCGGDGRIQKCFERTFSNRCPECNGYGTVSETETPVVLSEDQTLPKYHPDPIWKRFTTKDVQQDMVEKGWRKINPLRRA